MDEKELKKRLVELQEERLSILEAFDCATKKILWVENELKNNYKKLTVCKHNGEATNMSVLSGKQVTNIEEDLFKWVITYKNNS